MLWLQPRPPQRLAVMMERVAYWVPPLQDLVHLLNLDHLEILQSTGQLSQLQGLVWLRTPTALPPWAGALMTERVRVLEPMPQVLEQALNLDQAETLPSMGQLWELQARAERKPEQPRPPKAPRLMMLRVRRWTPLPQVLVQEVQRDQAETLQSMGQRWRLHTRCFVAGQELPPWE
jgi:hypothetical protein